MAPKPQGSFSHRARNLSNTLIARISLDRENAESSEAYRVRAKIGGEAGEVKEAQGARDLYERRMRRNVVRLEKVNLIARMKEGVYEEINFNKHAVRSSLWSSLARPEILKDAATAKERLSFSSLSGFKSGAAYKRVLADSSIRAGAQDYIDALRYLEFLALESAKAFPGEEYSVRMRRNLVRLKAFLVNRS